MFFAKWWRDQELIGLTSGNFEKMSDKKIQASVRNMIGDKKEHHWMIKADSKTVGHINLCRLSPSKAELQIVIGEKDYWEKGIGKKAVELVLENAKKLNYKEIYIEIRPENSRARNLYKNLGFIERGTKKYRNKYLPKVIMMTKNL